MTLFDVINNQSNIVNITATCDCQELCSGILAKMFTPLLWNTLISFGAVILIAIMYLRMPRNYRKDVVEKSPHFFMRHISDAILILLVATGWLAGGSLAYVVFG